MSTATLDKLGRLTIPADIRAKADLLPGEELVVSSDGPGRLTIMTRRAARLRAQERFAQMNLGAEATSDALLAERRREAERE